MKRFLIFLAFTLSLLALVSCGDKACQHRDADDNSLCDKCGESYTDGKDIENCQHIYLSTVTDPTCEEAGTKTFSCSLCEYSYTEIIAALGHNYINHEGKPATCYEDGWEAYQTCSRCDYNSYVELPAGHRIENGFCTKCKLPESTPGLEYSKNFDGTYTVTGMGDCQETSISIGIYEDSYVTSIGGGAFRDCSSLKSVTIGDSVTSICKRAFESCINLTSVTIGNSVTRIDDSAFIFCPSLISVTIGNSVTSIGEGAFANCYKLVEVINKSSLNITKGSLGHGHIGYYALCVHNGESKIVTVGDYLFITCDNVNYLLGYTGTATDITLPESYNGDTYEIYNSAFWNCTSLTIVTIPDSVTSIGEYAFESCSSLKSVTIGDSVTSIGDGAFSSCRSLTGVTIGNSVTSIGGSAFSGCTSLTSIKADANNTAYKDIDGNLYSKDGKILIKYAVGKTDKSFTIPNSVTSIGDSAFYGCENLTSVTIPGSVTSIGERAFYGCSSLTSVTIGNGVTSIGDYAFCDCSSLTSVTIGNSVTSIGDYAFYYCTSLKSVIIPDSVTSIGNHAFEDCSSLTSVTIGNGVTSIGFCAFSDCSSLKSVTFNNPNGWWRASRSDATSGTSITGLSDASLAAKYLTSTYCNYHWRRG